MSEHLTRDEIIELVRAQAWPEGDRRIVHSMAGMFGADWDAEDVARDVLRETNGVRFVDDLFDHRLEIMYPPTDSRSRPRRVRFLVDERKPLP